MSEEETETRNPRIKWKESLHKNINKKASSFPSKNISVHQITKSEVMKRHKGAPESDLYSINSRDTTSTYGKHEVGLLCRKSFNEKMQGPTTSISTYYEKIRSAATQNINFLPKATSKILVNGEKQDFSQLLCEETLPPSPIMSPVPENNPISPVPPMSPETADLYNFLAKDTEFFQNVEKTASLESAENDNPETIDLPLFHALVSNKCEKHASLMPENREKLTINITEVKRTHDERDSLPLLEEEPICVEKSLSTAPTSLFFAKELPEEKSIEAPPYFPLTPNPGRILANNKLFSPLEERPEEKSIEAPPYSPLTPNPGRILAPNKLFSPLEERPEEKNIEAPPYSPLTTNPGKIMINDKVVALPTLRPKQTCALLSKESKEIMEIAECSDDCVKDPDYECSDKENGNFSDSSSDMSVSIITCQADIHENFTNFVSVKRNDIETNIEDTPSLNLNNHEEGEPNDNDNRPINQDSNLDSMIVEHEEIVTANSPIDRELYTGRPRKGRKRKYGGMTRDERKKRKYMNQPYVNSRKKYVNSKLFVDFKCTCPKKCHKLISVEKRQQEFNKFYSLGTYNSQNMYIAACVKETPVKRSYTTTNKTNVSKKKTFSREYFLQGIRVCRPMFVNSLQTTPKRINTSLCKMRSNNAIIDNRGQHAGHNKVHPESEFLLINTIKKLPKYVSHYRRNECNEAAFLKPGMTMSAIYKLYLDEAKEVGVVPVSLAKAKQIFTTKFNLRTKTLKKDTCNKCDTFAIKIAQAKDAEKVLLENQHSEHLNKAKTLQDQLKSDMALAKTDPLTETLTFDLEKTLPLPRIPTNIVFYKRQLWVYNLGIHNGSDDQAFCNVWVEGEAGRGAQEVGSCLLKHSENLKQEVKNLILWSDSCGGQNRNIKLTLMLKACLNDHPSLETITIRFLESGHSFLPNDTDFGKIESGLKLQQRLYDYIEVMKKCRKNKPIIVQRIKKNDFFSSQKLENLITNRKKAIDGSKVSWLSTKEIILKKADMFSIFMSPNLETNSHVEVNIKKARGRPCLINKAAMEPLWPNGKPIPQSKLDDIKSLFHLIPDDAKAFYNTLVGNDGVEDDVDGFSGTPDFDFEQEDD